ncbi:MAG: nuclear transport factor 2 family protein [Acidimicrobiales bacterium]
MDWEAWARRAERALDVRARGDWKGLFAPGATFADPATTTPTEDLRSISRDTRSVFPDWAQEITSIRGGEDWAVFEWVGSATYRAPDGGSPEAGDGARITMHGATIVEVDAAGLVTRWRDYLDRREPEEQIRAAARASRQR